MPDVGVTFFLAYATAIFVVLYVHIPYNIHRK